MIKYSEQKWCRISATVILLLAILIQPSHQKLDTSTLSQQAFQKEIATIIKESAPQESLMDKLNPLHWLPSFESNDNNKALNLKKYNPDVDLLTHQMAVRHGYPCEAHIFETPDGYLLQVYRIPCGRLGCPTNGRGSGQPVFLQHGLISSSVDWIIPGPEKSVAYILADLGYDVWLGNFRGNTNSKRHVNISNTDKSFWNFSWNEMALYDLPTQIDGMYRVRAESAKDTSLPTNSLIYIGHSMGTTTMFNLLSSKPEYNDKIKLFIAYAPVAFMTKVQSPVLQLVAPLTTEMDTFIKLFGSMEFMPQSKVLSLLAKYGCETLPPQAEVCDNMIFLFTGFDSAQFNNSLLPVITGHSPAGVSTKVVAHYGQEIHNGGDFRNYDYGKTENEKRYGQPIPPSYVLDNIRAPIALYYAVNDYLAGEHDVELLNSRLKTVVKMHKIDFEKFNHIDFVWGIDSPKLVYLDSIKLMEKYKV